MNHLSFIICWTPVFLLIIGAVFFKRPALDLSIMGLIFTFGLVAVFFKTPIDTVLFAGLDGVITTLPFILVIFTGIMLSTLMMHTGSLVRIVEWLMNGVKTAFHSILLISVGMGNLMEGMCVIAEPVVAPMLYAAGVSASGAAVLSILGYSGLLTLEFAGMIIEVLSNVTGISVESLGMPIGWLSFVSIIFLSAFIPYFLPKEKNYLKKLPVVFLCASIAGLTALLTVKYIGISISGITAGIVVILFLLLTGPKKLRINRQILRDISPFIILFLCLLFVNIIPFLKEITRNRLIFNIGIIPVHSIKLTPFFSAYTYLVISFIAACLILKITFAGLKKAIKDGLSKAWRPSLSMAFFGAMGQIITFSGYSGGFGTCENSGNIPWLLANGLFLYTGSLYPLFVPFLGWVGTFLTGYGIASLMLFGKLQAQAAGIMGVSAVWLSSGLAVGASIGSISSPFKIAIATPMCNATGQEGKILRITIPLGIGVSFLLGIILMFII